MSAADIKRIVDRYGISMLQARRAAEIADERFAGNIRLGVLWTEANALAVHVKGGPEARARWNDNWAYAARERRAAS